MRSATEGDIGTISGHRTGSHFLRPLALVIDLFETLSQLNVASSILSHAGSAHPACAFSFPRSACAPYALLGKLPLRVEISQALPKGRNLSWRGIYRIAPRSHEQGVLILLTVIHMFHSSLHGDRAHGLGFLKLCMICFHI